MELIVLDGLDGSGKSTQIDLLEQNLRRLGKKVKKISFPDYANESSALVKLYLSGAFGNDAYAVNAYAASSFYAVDRYASYKQFWQKDYEQGTVILAARYTTSNAIHQMGKLPIEEWDAYLAWLEDYEYGKLGLPRPDVVLFLEMEPEISAKLISSRYHGDESKRDIHEKNRKYLLECTKSARYAGKKLGFQMISCDDGETPYSIEQIQQKIMECIRKELNL
ncbi:MAG TPA: deoxynucleoside kinase [Firmicutes bacterium]|nr:deoxynucleoside kinase [Bacillota bacterium]